MIYKVIGPEISISTANTLSNATLVRVFNTNTTAQQVLHISNTSSEYANISVSPLRDTVIQKTSTDSISGTDLLAAPIAYKY